MRIALIGYGKMGKAIEQIALQRGHRIALTISSQNSKELNTENLQNVDVAIEFSTPACVFQNIINCFDANVPIVVGTTGWLEYFEKIKLLCETNKQTFFYSSNYSIGVNLFFKLNSFLAKLMNSQKDYKINIEEIHHTQKLDAPSGTAISLANQIIENNSQLTKWNTLENSTRNELPIISFREKEIIGTHTVNYKSDIDTISIKHEAISRDGFALGAVLAAEFIFAKKGYFTINDLLDSNFITNQI